MPDIDTKWNLLNIPPKGDKDVADFAFNLFEIARLERERLNKPADFLSNYALYRGKQSTGQTTLQNARTPVNLYFANIERTVSNITARQPVGEVVDLDGIKDGAEEVFSVKLKKWWKDTKQQSKTRASARTMEIYGITPEKPYWDKDRKEPDVMVTDPYAFFPAPGNWEDISTEPPYVCFAYLDFVDKAEADFEVKGIAHDDAYELLGVEREKYRADNYGMTQQRLGNYEDPMARVNRSDRTASDKKIERCLIIEVWVRDKRKRTRTQEFPILDSKTDQPIFDDDGNQLVREMLPGTNVYPDTIRKITIAGRKPGQKSKDRSQYMVLDDCQNPNINYCLNNPILPPASQTHPWGRFPVYTANSYRDLVSIWGFAAAEQVGDLVIKINQIFTKLIAYVINVMAPPLIVQQHCGITRQMIETQLTKSGRLILMPTTPNARIEFMQIPNLPATFFQVLELIVRFFDRVYQIEDADRGQAPKGVIAASAIVALQERNQVLMQAKTSSIDTLAENRSRWAIGLWQNFGTKAELVEVNDKPMEFIGSRYAGRKFSYVVEAGSTTPRTSLQIQEMAAKLFEGRAIDRRALLEALNWPGWKEIVERMGETELDAALQVLIDAGMPEEEAIELKQWLMQPQGGPGDTGDGKSNQTRTVKPAGAKSGQGQTPPAQVQGG